MLDTISSKPPRVTCAREGCGRAAHKGQPYCHQHGISNATYPHVPSLRNGRAVCPLRSAEPVYFSHYLLAVNEPGEIVERCACGFERRIAWGNVAVEVVEREDA